MFVGAHDELLRLGSRERERGKHPLLDASGIRTVTAVPSSGEAPVPVGPEQRMTTESPGAEADRVQCAPTSSDLEIVAVRTSMEADLRGDHVGREATGLLNTNRDRTAALPLLNSERSQ